MDKEKKEIVHLKVPGLLKRSEQLIKRGLLEIDGITTSTEIEIKYTKEDRLKITNKKILFVANEDAIIKSILVVLKRISIETIVARSFQEVIPILKKGKYPLLILTNFALSPFDIPATVSNVRKSDHETIILVMSGYYNNEFINDLKTRGVDYFFHLPFDMQEFSNKVKEII